MRNLSLELARLAIEAQQVIWLRTIRIAAGGPAAYQEVNLMVTEKASALLTAAGTIATGGSAHAVVSGYRKKVRSNVRRLSA